MTNSNWCHELLEIVNSKDKSTKSAYFSLNDLAFERLKECRTNKHGTISYKTIWSKLCPQFSIKKSDCMKLLRYFKEVGKIEYVGNKGIRIK